MLHHSAHSPAQQSTDVPSSSSSLSETQVILGFHTLLKHALTQAKADGLLSDDDLAYLHPGSAATADGVDVEVTGPALCLFFAALKAKGDPAEIEFAPPDAAAHAGSDRADQLLVLSEQSCPPSFLPFFKVWQQTVLPIHYLPAEHRYDLALMISEKEPVSSPVRMDVVNICNDLKRVAIDIAQRRSFQLRFSTDLQHALDSTIRSRPPSADMTGQLSQATNLPSHTSPHTRYEPPPSYTSDEANTSQQSQQRQHNHSIVSDDKRTHLAPQHQDGSGTVRPALPPRPLSSSSLSSSSRVPTQGSAATVASDPAADTLILIRETLFSALGDCFALYPSLREIVARSVADASNHAQPALNEWSSRACFACLCLAILEVALTRIVQDPCPPGDPSTTPVRGIKTVQVSQLPPQTLHTATCPAQLADLLRSLLDIGTALSHLTDLDTQIAIAAAQSDPGPEPDPAPVPPQPQLDRLRHMLLTGGTSARVVSRVAQDVKVGSHDATPLQVAAARADALGVEINQVAMRVFALPGVRERLADAMAVLAAVHSL